MIVSREIAFEAFHSHKGMLTEPKHPHTWRVQVAMAGEPNEEGFICDYRAVKRTFNKLVGTKLEGRNLDEMFEYATSENLAAWVWAQLAPFFPLYSITVYEKPHSRAVYFGPEKERHGPVPEGGHWAGQ